MTGPADLPVLPQSFYLPDSRIVARRLLGRLLVRESPQGVMAGRIVETEAYRADDPACHAHGGRTERNSVMFGPPGHAYVYFSYGMHHLLNFVTEPEGTPGAVLIRALEPVFGLEFMRGNRPGVPERQLTNGPGKLTQAMSIDISENGATLYEGALTVRDPGAGKREAVVSSARIGISKGCELEWRYCLSGNPWLSRSCGRP